MQLIISIIKTQRLRLIITSLLLFCLACNMFYYAEFQVETVSFIDAILFQSDDKNTVCFGFLFLFMFFCGDLISEDMLLTHNNAVCTATKITIICVLLTAIFIILFFLMNVLAYFIMAYGDYEFLNVHVPSWSTNPLYFLGNSLLLLFLRFFAISLFTNILNYILKNPWGIVATIFLTFFDYNFYYYTKIEYPLFLTPMEHTLVTFDTMSFVGFTKTNNIVSICYWCIILTMLYFILRLINKHYNEKLNSKRV